MKILYVILLSMVGMIITMASSGFVNSHVRFIIEIIPYGDKIFHFLLIGITASVANLLFNFKRYLIFTRYRVFKGSFWIAIIFTFEEFSQIFLETRSFEIADLCSNYGGILTAGFLAKIILDRLSINRSLKPQ